MAIPTINIFEVNETDTPNEGRIKWNTSIANLIADRTNFVRADGTTGNINDIDYNSFRAINLAPAVNDYDSATFIQVKEYAYKPFNKKCIYVQDYLDSTIIEYIYKDGTGDIISVRCGSLQTAINNIPTDTSSISQAWTIKLDGGIHLLDVDTLNKTVNIEGYGNPIIDATSSSSLVNNVPLHNKGIVRNCVIRAYQPTNNPITLTVYEGIYKNVILYAKVDNAYVQDSNIVVKSAIVTESDLIATNILMDSTALGGMVENCRLKNDLANPEMNVDMATNKIITNLDELYKYGAIDG